MSAVDGDSAGANRVPAVPFPPMWDNAHPVTPESNRLVRTETSPTNSIRTDSLCHEIDWMQQTLVMKI